jgi:hypothetical protein
LLDAIRGGDVTAFLAFFGPDSFVSDWGSRYVGPAQIRAWSDREFIGKQVTLTVTGTTVSSDEVGISAEVGGNGFNGPSHFLFVLDGGMVREMRITA